jgi:hypothetical protein
VGYIAGINLYTYCFNNPVNWIDPWGWDTYYTNYELGKSNPHPTNNPVSHSYVAITDNGRVTDTFSWGNNGQGRWFRNDPLDMAVAQRAINSGIGVERYGGENLDPFVIMQFQNRQNDTSLYDLLLNNCKQNAADLLADARNQQRQERQKLTQQKGQKKK